MILVILLDFKEKLMRNVDIGILPGLVIRLAADEEEQIGSQAIIQPLSYVLLLDKPMTFINKQHRSTE